MDSFLKNRRTKIVKMFIVDGARMNRSSKMNVKWVELPAQKNCIRVGLNLPGACYQQPTQCGDPSSPYRQRHLDPNHGRLIKVIADDNRAKYGDSGVYLEFVGPGKHGPKHRVMTIRADGTLDDCHNIRENRFLIRNNSLAFVSFDLLSEEHEIPRYMSPTVVTGLIRAASVPYPGYPGRYHDTKNPEAKISPRPGVLIDDWIDSYLSTMAKHIAKIGIRVISDPFMRAIHSRLCQWVAFHGMAEDEDEPNIDQEDDLGDPDDEGSYGSLEEGECPECGAKGPAGLPCGCQSDSGLIYC